MKNEWEQINKQIAIRTQKQQEELIAKTSEVYYHREDYCNNLEVTTSTQATTFNSVGLRCKLQSQNKLLPSEVDTMCSKYCHSCSEYIDYIEPVRTIIDEFDEDIDNSDIIESEDATEDDVDCYYEHLMKEHYVAYDEEELDKFYKERPGIHRYNKLVWAFKSTGLKAGDYLDYAMPADILKEEDKFEDKLAKALGEAQYGRR